MPIFRVEDIPAGGRAAFFGRTAKVQEMINRLRNNFGTPKEERFLALIGASGSGKSSSGPCGSRAIRVATSASPRYASDEAVIDPVILNL
jgi:hypothetical protein